MPVQQPAPQASFSLICRSNYFHDIRPADAQAKNTKGYMEAIGAARSYFAAGRQQAFGNYLQEAKYLANLWAAHLLLEYGEPDEALRKACLEVIERYAADTFDRALAGQEQRWLAAYAASCG